MVLVNCNIFLWISAFCNNKSGGPQDVSSTRTSLWSNNCSGVDKRRVRWEGGATPPQVCLPRTEAWSAGPEQWLELPPRPNTVRQSAASRAGVRCWVRPRMRPTRARAPKKRAPRGANRPLGGAGARAAGGATLQWCPGCR